MIISEERSGGSRRTDLGRIPVCSVCGNNLLSHPFKGGCCKDSKRITLKQYVEEIKGEIFDNQKWSWENIQ